MKPDDVYVMGLDVSKERTGWAIISGMKCHAIGCIHCPKVWQKTKHNDPEFNDLLFWYEKQIEYLIKRYLKTGLELKCIAMEDLNIQYAKTAKVMLQFQAAARLGVMRGSEEALPIELIHNQTVKSAFKIRVDKKDIGYQDIIMVAKSHKVKEVKILMVDAINGIFDLKLDYSQNDEADAIALAYTAILKRIK
jgi:Holliday junction resolvasome RuvABC endonuclease subunit